MTDHSGQYFGRYYLTERLGEGGMAVVYKAYDTRLERDIAIKIIRSGAFPSDDLAEILKRFEREAKSLAKLSHPSIVKVYDFGEHDGSPYLVMEYLPGGTLKKFLVKPIPWQDAVRLILPVARGVAYAHKRGLLHRDIKPANVLITDDGEPMLSDFGIAKLFEGDQTTALTGSGMAIGTPEYMAPEQWTGSTSPQSDQYSLGIVLYEMVAGRKPYVADTPGAILIKQVTEPLPGPRKFVADLPEALEHILIKALAKEPGDRYPDINAFIGALEALKVSAPVLPRAEQERVIETYRIPAQKPAPTVAAQQITQADEETLAVADVDEPQPMKKASASPTAVAKARNSIKLSRRSMGIVVGGIIILAVAWFGLPLVGKMLSSLPAATQQTAPTATSDIPVVASKTLLPVQVQKTVTPTIAPTSTVTPRPLIFSGAKIGVLTDENGSFFVDLIDPEDLTNARISLDGNIRTDIIWSPDGSKFLYWDANKLYAYDRISGKSSFITESQLDYRMTWSPNGDLIAFESKKETASTAVTIVNTDGSGRRILVNGYLLGWSPDGKWILYNVGGYSWDKLGGVARVEYISVDGSSRGIIADGAGGAWSSNGDWVLYELSVADYRYTSVQLYDFVNKEYAGQIMEKAERSLLYSWAPDDNFVILRTNDKAVIVDLLTRNSKELFNATTYDLSMAYVPPAWSPDSQKLAIVARNYVEGNATRKIFIVDRTSLQVSEMGQGESPIWSPDGKWLAFTSTRDGDNSSLYVVRADGSDLTRVTNDQSSHYSPYWIP